MIDLNDAGVARLRYDRRDIAERLKATAASWIPQHFPHAVLQHDRRSMKCGDLTGRAPTGDGSCVLRLTGEYAGTGYDHATSQSAGPIKLLEYATGLKGKELLEYAARLVGIGPVEVQRKIKPPQFGEVFEPTCEVEVAGISRQDDAKVDDRLHQEASQDNGRRAREVERIISGCKPLAGSPAIRYLEGRGLRAPDCPDLRYCNDLTYGNRQYDGLVAIIRNEKSERTGGILRIFLTDDGTAKAEPGKKMLGPVAGGAVQLGSVGDDGHVGIAEGLETSLAVTQLFEVPCWASLSTSGLKRWVPPANVRRVTIFADAGEPGMAAASALSARLAALNVEVHIREPLHGDDFNHDLMRGATMADYETSRAIITPKDSDITPPIGRAAMPRCYNKLLMSDREIPRPLNLMFNGSLILRTEPCFDGRIRQDDFRDAIVCRDMPWDRGGDWREWTDGDDIRLAEWAQAREVYLNPGTCAQAVNAVASDNKFHPIREYLGGLTWDGVPRLDTWLSKYLEVADTAYARAVGRCWLISGVARIRSPGSKVDHVLILEGDQRLRKSSALKALMPDPEWFTDDMETLGTKDAAQGLRGKWLIEVAELSALKRSEVETIKAFVTRAVDHYRPSYARRSRSFPRQSFFGGTTNQETYLADETGNRRFWPVRCQTAHIAAIERDRDQLWAEADHAFRNGERWWLDEAMELEAAEEQRARRIIDPWEEQIVAWADRQAGEVTVSRILDECIDLPMERRDQAAQNRVARILRASGFRRRQVRVSGQRVWIYERNVTRPDGLAAASGGDVVTHQCIDIA